VSSAAPIEGVVVLELEAHADQRGSFAELFRASWVPGAPTMRQANVSTSRTGVLRGMHFHRMQADWWYLLEGRYFVALRDLREGSPTQTVTWTREIDAGAESVGLYLPSGVAHGFLALSDIVLVYLVDREFTGEDEFGFRWDDPDAGIRWPYSAPVLSDRDATAPPLAEVLRDPPRYPA
jgi:dTDP-4-dehydrorhamnose 3,5-epimerase